MQPSMATQRSVQFRIFHQWNVRKTADLLKNVTLAEDPMITERETEYLDSQVSKRITHPINPFGTRQAEPKTTANIRLIAQTLFDFVERVSRNRGVGMKKPENVALCDLSSRIHLSRAPSRTLNNLIGQISTQFRRCIIALAIDYNNFGAGRP